MSPLSPDAIGAGAATETVSTTGSGVTTGVDATTAGLDTTPPVIFRIYATK